MTSGSATGRAKIFSADVTASRTAQDGFDAFRREWEAQVGEPWPLNGLDAAASSDFKINVQAVSAHDVVIADVYSASYVGRTMPDHETDGWVLLHLMRHGSWRLRCTGRSPRPGRRRRRTSAADGLSRHSLSWPGGPRGGGACRKSPPGTSSPTAATSFARSRLSTGRRPPSSPARHAGRLVPGQTPRDVRANERQRQKTSA
jgi:hypothetical protein